MNFIVIYITHKNKKEAKKVAEALLRDRLIACVNYFPIESSYWWKGELATAKEIVTLVKTKKENWAKVKKAVEAIHPYETPCIMKFDVESNVSYAKWIKDETK
ncbi:MAG: divalent-cation tolerance protein CutA [Candidatus Moranbacteria bacterium]|nr:divalent-cation tolerance protein CutA [Candidatus Moranbacteria bacterium]